MSISQMGVVIGEFSDCAETSSSDDLSPLQLALGHLSIRTTRLLLRNGANLDYCDLWERNVPISMFWRSERPEWDESKRGTAHELIQMFSSCNAIENPIIVENDVNIGMSLLSRAIFDGDCSLEMIKLLLSISVLATSQTDYSRPFYMAVLRERLDLLLILEKYTTIENRDLAMLRSAKVGNVAMLQHLVNNGRNTYRQNILATALQAAVKHGQSQCTRLLIGNGAMIEAEGGLHSCHRTGAI